VKDVAVSAFGILRLRSVAPRGAQNWEG
jgi:hypothetical protein